MKNALLNCFSLLALALTLLTGAPVNAHEHALREVTDDMATAATVWLNSLNADQRKIAAYELSAEERVDWHFVPRPLEGDGVRNGLSLKAMRPDQRHLAYALLASGLSHKGYLTATQIMSLERVLHELENNAPYRDTEMYYLSIFGKPGGKNWAWSFEGHHLSLNFTVAEGTLTAATPNFFASNPATIMEGPRKGLQVLDKEENVARALVKSLTSKQLTASRFSENAPGGILTAADPIARHLGEKGIAFGDLKKAQQALLFELISVYVKRVRGEFAEAELAAIKQAGHDKIIFAWAGGLEKGQGHYYRVQGPTFLLEYANTQNNAAHVHSVWRDFDGDFGRDVLKEHYLESHKDE